VIDRQRVDVPLEHVGIDYWQPTPAVKEGGGCEPPRSHGSQFGDRAAVTSHGHILAGFDAIDDVSRTVAQLANRHGVHVRSVSPVIPLSSRSLRSRRRWT